jgi:hypothetical protein
MNRIALALLTTSALGCMLLSCGKGAASDQALTTDIQAKLYADAVTKPTNIGVAVKNGVVTLSGDVPTSDVELEAMKIANSTSGVKSVSDQIKVNPSMAANQLPNTGNQSPQNPPPNSYPPSSQPAASAAPSQPAPAPETGAPSTPPAATAAAVTVPAGQHISVRMIDSIDSARNTAGQVFRASLYQPLVSHGRVIVPAGAPVSVLLTQAKDAGRIKGHSELEVRLSAIEYHGRRYRVDSSIYEEQGKGRGNQTAARTGIGAVAGAVIGAIAGGGKGAAIGAGAGGGAGFGTALFTHGEQVKIPSETVLTFRLRAPLRIQQ